MKYLLLVTSYFLFFIQFAYGINFVAVGDIMLSRGVGYNNKIHNYTWTYSVYNPFYQFYLENKPDFIVGNFEGVFGMPDNDYKKPSFKFVSNPKNIYILDILKNCSKSKQLVLNLANNHIRNGGRDSILLTKKLLKKHGIISVGVGLTPKESHKIGYIFDSSGDKICFQGYSYDGGYRYGIAVNSINLKYIKKDVEKMNKIKCDKKIIFLHWGREYKFNPTKKQKYIAKKISEMGVDYIIGGHSHVIGTSEKIGNTMVIYSLGNAIFDQNWGEYKSWTNMDKVYGKVPTYIGTVIGLDNKGIYDELFYRINYGKLEVFNNKKIKQALRKILLGN